MRRPPTIIDVASHAGVSKSTVSNVLQEKTNVNAQLRERVLETIALLGYQPHAGARNLRQQSDVVGVVVGDLCNPFHAELAAFIEAHAAERKHSILLVSTGGVPEREGARVNALIEHRVAAMIFLTSPSDKVLRLASSTTPTVLVSATSPSLLSYSIDDAAGTCSAVEHLVALGHQEIGFVSLMLADEPQIELARFRGYQQAMKAAGLQISPSHLLREHTKRRAHRHSYHDLLLGLLDRRDRPTGIVAGLDRIALEIMSAADILGLRVPEDISLVGFDNIAVSGHSRIALTTIAQPMEDLAALAVDAAIGLSSGASGFENRTLPPRLIVRNSTAAPSPLLLQK